MDMRDLGSSGIYRRSVGYMPGGAPGHRVLSLVSLQPRPLAAEGPGEVEEVPRRKRWCTYSYACAARANCASKDKAPASHSGSMGENTGAAALSVRTERRLPTPALAPVYALPARPGQPRYLSYLSEMVGREALKLPRRFALPGQCNL
jgi:hypothetical protein